MASLFDQVGADSKSTKQPDLPELQRSMAPAGPKGKSLLEEQFATPYYAWKRAPNPDNAQAMLASGNCYGVARVWRPFGHEPDPEIASKGARACGPRLLRRNKSTVKSSYAVAFAEITAYRVTAATSNPRTRAGSDGSDAERGRAQRTGRAARQGTFGYGVG